MKEIKKIEQALGHSFTNPNLLQQALVHRSYVNENRGFTLGHNERLEFLGDAVLELVVTDELYERFPHKSEGELTAVRAALVNAKSLSESANDLGVDGFLLMSKGESKSAGRARSFILANALEAIIGALYKDQGYEAARAFIAKCLFHKIDSVVHHKLWIDSKSLFQEKSQEVHGITPEYRVLKETGPDHDKVFTVGVFVGDKLRGEGTGASKQDAEQEAARRALEDAGWV